MSLLLASAVFCSAAFANGLDAGTPLRTMSVGHVPQAVAAAQAPRLSALAADRHLQLAISLPLRNQADLNQLLEELQDPTSVNYHQYLTGDEFTERFGPSKDDYDELIAWAQSKGFTLTGTTPNRRLIEVDGDIATINQALHVSMGNYQHPTEARQFFAPDREPTLDLAVPLLSISGLNNFVPPSKHLKQADLAKALSGTPRASGSGPSGEFLPSDMRKAYYGSGSLTGSGQTIGIFSFDGYKAADVGLFYTKTGETNPNVPITNVLVGGFGGTCQNPCDDGEQILDIVNAAGMAPGITKILFYEGNSATSIMNRMVTDNSAKVLSCSWYGNDFDNPTDDPIYQQMAAQGQTFVNASGDDGAYNSQAWGAPSADPYVLEVGGTDLVTSGAGGPWSSETGWTDSGGGYYSGAGESTPSYQLQAGVINTSNKGSTTYRNDPDVSAEANFDNPTISNGSLQTGYGGTSFAAPRWAGFIALINQQSIANGNGPVGFVNPALYTIGLGANYHSDFHDITSGSNPPTVGSGPTFNAVANFDLVTGWGSPAAPLVTALAGGGSGGTPDFSIADAPGTLSVARGASGTSTITVSPSGGFSGSVSFAVTGLPSGVTGSFSPASTTTTTTLTLTASSTATTGTATLTITGTSGSLHHTATLNLTVTTAGGGSVQVVANPSFESTASWTASSGVICATGCSGESAHTGSGFAWLNGYGSTHTDTLSQSLAIPSGHATATLQYYLHIDTAETTTSTAYDKLTVGLYNSSGTLLTTLATYSNLNKNTGYTVQTSDVSAYIGQTVTLKFTGTEDSSAQTSFVLDDVTLTAN